MVYGVIWATDLFANAHFWFFKYSQNCLQRSATGNYKSGLCWQMAFVRNVRNYFL